MKLKTKTMRKSIKQRAVFLKDHKSNKISVKIGKTKEKKKTQVTNIWDETGISLKTLQVSKNNKRVL